MESTPSAWVAWLPDSALDGAVVEDALGEPLRDWSARWLGRPVRILGGLRKQPTAVAATKDERWRALDEGLALGVTPRGRIALAGLMLGRRIDEKALNAADRALIERLAEGCLDDLRTRLARLLRLPGEIAWSEEAPTLSAWPRSHACAIGPMEGEPMLRLRLAAEGFVAMIKQAVRLAPAPIQVRPLTEGLAHQPLRLSAFVGACELPLSELASLAEGDVVVLEREVSSPLDLAIGGGGRAGRCQLDIDDEKVRLKIHQPFFEQCR